MKTKTKWIAIIAIMLTVSFKVNAQNAKSEAIIYANADANYGFRIIIDGKIVLEQEQILAEINGKTIYFNKIEAEIAAAYVLTQVKEGTPPAPINYSTWQQIQKTSNSK